MAVNTDKAKGRGLGYSSKRMAACPVATVDVVVNTDNRNLAIKERGYGPMNPDEPNKDFWKGIGDLWGISVEEAKQSRCGNCAAFIQTPEMIACIQSHLGYDEDYPKSGAKDMNKHRTMTLDAADLGYCQLFAFKCAADRVCRAWLHGGPVK